MKRLNAKGLLLQSTNHSDPHKKLQAEDIRINFRLIVYSLPCILCAICYSNITSGDFVHDDIFAIKNNADVTGSSSLSSIWVHDFWGFPIDSAKSHKSYRPLATLLFRFDYLLSGGNPNWFHVVNICLHTVVTFLVAYLCTHVLNTTPLVSLLASCLFAVHPIHTEAVSSIVGRADVLAAFFFLLSFILYARCIELEEEKEEEKECKSLDESDTTEGPSNKNASLYSQILLATCLLSAIISSLCKETGFTVLGVCFVYDVIKHSDCILRPKGTSTAFLSSILRRLLAVSITGMLFLWFRMSIMGFQAPSFQYEENPASFSESRITRLLTFSFLLPFNVWLLLCPRTLSYDWQVGSIPLVESLWDSRNAATLLFFVVYLMLILRFCRRLYDLNIERVSRRSNAKQTAETCLMAIVLASIPFIPASNIFVTVGFVVAERILYIPSIGFSILVSQGIVGLLNRIPRFKSHILMLFTTLLLILAGRTWNRNPIWASRKALFRSGVIDMPSNAKVHFNMGNYYKDTKELELAVYHYQQAIKLHPNHPSYHNNLGIAVTNQNESERHFRQALNLYPGHKGALVNLGNLMISQDRPEGLQFLEKALDIDSGYVEGLLSMGKALFANNRSEDAEQYIRRAIELQPNLSEAHIYYAALFHHTGRLENAMSEYQHAFALNNENTVAMRNAAISLRALKRYKETEFLLKRALSFSKEAETYLQLGILYAQQGRQMDAVSAYEDAVILSPNNTAANLHYIQALSDSQQQDVADRFLSDFLQRVHPNLDVLRFTYNYYLFRGRFNEAFPYLEEAITQAISQHHPSLGELYHDKANIYRKWSDHNQSLKFYKLSVESDPSNIKSYINIGTIYHIQGNYSKAEEFYKKALSINPVNELAISNMNKLRTVWRGGNPLDKS